MPSAGLCLLLREICFQKTTLMEVPVCERESFHVLITAALCQNNILISGFSFVFHNKGINPLRLSTLAHLRIVYTHIPD